MPSGLIMRVLVSYSSYPSTNDDWRARFMYDMLHSLARTEGLEVAAWGPPGPVPANLDYTVGHADAHWLADMLAQGGIAHLLRTTPAKGILTAFKLSRTLRQAYKNCTCDIYHINWLQNALSLPDNGTPALITALGTDMKLLKLPGMTSALRRVFKKHACILAPNADWMVPELTKRFQDVVTAIKPVPFGIENRWYDIRHRPDIERPRRWVSVIRLTEKKVGELFNWGEHVFTVPDELHLYGPNQENLLIPPWVHYHGPVGPDELINDIYPEAHGYISLSQHDEGRPQAILEAMAAGLPIVASNINAHRNLLEETEGGILVDNLNEFSQAIKQLTDQDSYKDACREARNFIMKEHGTWDDCAQRYLKLYTILLEEK